MKNDNILSSGEIAKYCGVNLRTVIRWIDKGHLKAHKLPGRGNNRVKREDFISFLKTHEMPIPQEFQTTSSKVLVVDDDKAMAASIRRIINRLGIEVEVANDGFQAGIKLAEFQPTLLILDLMMPKMNGFEVLAFLHDSPFRDIKVLVLSGAGDEALNRALELGATATLEKPFRNDELKQLIIDILDSIPLNTLSVDS